MERLTKSQLVGGVILLVTALMIYSTKSIVRFLPIANRASIAPYSLETPCSIAVKITGIGNNDGLYFLPGAWTCGDFLEMIAPIDALHMTGFDRSRILANGEKVVVDRRTGAVRIGQIENHEKLALEIPIDINTATAEDLVLIPGIGETSAKALITYRTARGGFTDIDEIKSIHGFGEGRLKMIKRYLVLDR